MTTAPLVDIVRYNPVADRQSLCRVPIEVAKDAPLPIGFAYLVVYATRRPISGMFRYLLDTAENGGRRKTGSFCAETNRTYANLLKPSAEAMLLEDRPYDYLDDEVVDLVVASMLDGVTRRGKPFSGGTISAVVDALCRCTDHTNDKGLTAITIDRDAALAKAWRVDSIYDRDGKLLPRADLQGDRRHMIRPLAMTTIERIEGLLVQPGQWTPKTGTSRPALTFDNGRRNGFRLVENLGIHVEDVMRFTILDPDVEVQFPLRRTKGADGREVLVEGRDIKRWQTYCNRERAACVKKAKDDGLGYEEPPNLLVNGLGSGVGLVGRATQPSTIQRDFRQIQRRLGMFAEREVASPGGGVQTIVVYEHCYHDLRHTAAMNLYDVALLRGGNAARDPIAFVQIRLGHAHRSTTEKIYLFPDRRRTALVGDMAVDATRALRGG